MEPKNNETRLQSIKSLENLRMRLLDLTARNRLINFRHSKAGSLRVIDELPNQLVEALLGETEMRFEAIPEPTERQLIDAGYLEFDERTHRLTRLKNDPTAEEWARYQGLATSYEVPQPSGAGVSGKHSDSAIQTLLYPYELESRLKALLQVAESAIQEMGANILYLSFGFLEWHESGSVSNDSARIAPLFLVPVRLNKGRLNPRTRTYEYTLSYSGEDIIPNLSLREKLRVDFAMALPDLSESTVPEDYFSEVQALIQDQPRWRLRRYISLSLLNFSKLLMYLDLDPARWPKDANIIDHPLVSRFLSGEDRTCDPEKGASAEVDFGEEFLIDEMVQIHSNYPLIDDADSSQHSALIDAIDGKNLVIEGPPGTGKSQTITNLIAAALAQGKKVLFVAEKLAALEVVRRRLDRAELGEFCLELHSHKSQKRKVLDEVESRLKKHGRYRRPEDIEIEIARYEELKSALKMHAEKINRRWKKTGKTLHEIFMAATRYRNAICISPAQLHPVGWDGDNYDVATQRRHQDQVQAFGKMYLAVSQQLSSDADLLEHPWYGIRNGELQIFDLGRVNESLEKWQVSLKLLAVQREEIAQLLECNSELLAEGVKECQEVLTDLEKIPILQGDEFLAGIKVMKGQVLEKVRFYLKLFEDTQEMFSELSKVVAQDTLKDLSFVENMVSGSKKLALLIGADVKLGVLEGAIGRLKKLHNQLIQIEEPLLGLRGAMGPSAVKYLAVSESGLKEYADVIGLISDLNPSYWKSRGEVFDNDELDDLLPRLREEVEDLRELRDRVQDTFSLESIPDEPLIRSLHETLLTGGLLRWFKKDWRNARKQLISYSSHSAVRYSVMLGQLDDAASYVRRRNSIARSTTYSEALGQHLRGADTDLEALEGLRSWYKRVRQKYGVGFNQKASLGEAILGLDPMTGKAIRSLVEQGVQSQVDAILNELAHLKFVFSPVPDLMTSDAQLTGEEGLVPRLLRELDSGINACAPLIVDASRSISDLTATSKQIAQLKKQVEHWHSADYDNKLFLGALRLQFGDADNSVGLSILRNTIELASCLDGQLSKQLVVKYIRDYPSKETFAALSMRSALLRKAVQSEKIDYEHFALLVGLDFSAWTHTCGNQLEQLISRAQLALDNGEALQYWLDYVRVRDQLDSMGANKLIDAVEKLELPIEQVEDAYHAGIFDVLSREILTQDPELARFSGRSQRTLQEKFKEYDNKLKTLQCQNIAWRADQKRIPPGRTGSRVSDLTELALLDRECSKKTKHIPIRQLLKKAGGALIALKPCFMMGPMSVAQYLAPGEIQFDLIVMDEASQIKPQDALGAIARGAQLIVVGDPKQLPPTSFFDRIVDDEEDDPTGIEESESILDATLPMFPARRLRWHYRSEHESLIAFSNQSFYDSDLVIFPSPHKETENYGIQYVPVPRGCFVNRKNLEEARVISEAVREHFRSRSEETLGVVAMSAEQRLHIERAIETLAKEDTRFQEMLESDATRHEALFIKNLENVQGDERDVIYISMTYGPIEPGGVVHQRFGPINSDVGWRRLNVLFTRSKKRMHIFSSMRSDDILVNTTSKRGVLAMQNFLKFCETGILHTTIRDTCRAPDSDFEIAVMTALRAEGFDCIPQVGVAGFFIDVAVVDPGNPGRYLMGIECDGATYHSAKSARDRDRLRQSILERLGWKICRIWSTDWFKNSHGELAPIIRELNELKSIPPQPYPEFASLASEGSETGGFEQGKEEISDSFPLKGQELRETLTRYESEIIRKDFPDTPESKRLLRPAMLEALLEFTPTSKAEFLEVVPSYIRQATEPAEGKYLEKIFEIINASLENA